MSFVKIWVHLVFSTKNREPLLTKEVRIKLHQHIIENAKEKYGKDLYTTRNYKELLDKPDIDAVLICTHDVWHARIALDALAKGKHVYIEKPMVYKIDEGPKVIAAQKK